MMAWEDVLKVFAPIGGLESGELQLKLVSNGQWTLEQFMRGAARVQYSEEQMNNAIQQIGSTWDRVNSNSADGKALEVYLNKNNSGYALNAEQRTEFLREFSER